MPRAPKPAAPAISAAPAASVPAPTPEAPASPFSMASMFPSLSALKQPTPPVQPEAPPPAPAPLTSLEQQNLRKSMWQNTSRLAAPIDFDAATTGMKSQRTPGELVAESPIVGKQQTLAQWQAEHPNSPLSFSAPSKFAGWSTPSDQAKVSRSLSGGTYINDPQNDQTIAHENRAYSAEENSQILDGLDPSAFQIDHRTPLFAGGVDDISNKEILPTWEHEKKTAIQSVPLTLWRTFNNNPELAQKYGMTPLSLQQMRIAVDDWRNFSDVGIPKPDDNGEVPLDFAVKAWKAWHEEPKVGFWDVVKGMPSAFGQVMSSVGSKAMQMFEGVPVAGSAALGAIQGFGSEVGFGYPGKVAPGLFDSKSTMDKEGYSVLGTNAKGQKILYKSPSAGFKEANNAVYSVGKAAGGLLGSLVAMTRMTNIANKVMGKLGMVTAKAATAEAKGAEVIAAATKTPGLVTKAFATFGIKGQQAVANTEALAKQVVAASKGMDSYVTATRGLPIMEAMNVPLGKVPIVGDMVKAAIKTAQRGVTWNNIGTNIIFNLVHQQDDRSMNATVERAITDGLYGAVLGHDAHDLPGYLKVFGKSLTLATAQQSFMSPDKHDFAADLQNALMITGMHGISHKQSRIVEKGRKAEVEYFTEAQKALQARYDDLLAHRSSEVLSLTLPEVFKAPGDVATFSAKTHWESVPKTEADIALYRKQGEAAIEALPSTNFQMDKSGKVLLSNGKPVSSYSDADVARLKSTFNASLNILEMNGAAPAKKAAMEIANLKKWVNIFQKNMSGVARGMNQAGFEAATKDGLYLFSPSTSDGIIVTTKRAIDPEMPIGRTQTTGLGADTLSVSEESFSELEAARKSGTLASKVWLEPVQDQQMVETARRGFFSKSQAARKDTTSDPGSVVRAWGFVLQPDGTLKPIDMGLMPSVHRLENAEYAINKEKNTTATKQTILDGKQDYYSLDKDAIAAWAKKKKLGGVYAELMEFSSGKTKEGDAFKPYAKIEVTKDTLAHSETAFAGTHPDDNPQYQTTEHVMARAAEARTQEDTRKAVDNISTKMPVEPVHELLAMAKGKTGEPLPFADDVQKPLAMVHEGLQSGDPKKLMESINGTYGNILDEATATQWIATKADVRFADVADLFLKGTNRSQLNEEGLMMNKAIKGFYSSPARTETLLANGSINEMRVLGMAKREMASDISKPTNEAAPVPATEISVAEKPPVDTAVEASAAVPDVMADAPEFLGGPKKTTPPAQNPLKPSRTLPNPLNQSSIEGSVGDQVSHQTSASKDITAQPSRIVSESPVSDSVTDSVLTPKTFKRMPKEQKLIAASEPAPDAKPVDSASVSRTPPAEEIAAAERSIGAPIRVTSEKTLKALETSEPRIVDGVDADEFEQPTHVFGRSNGDKYLASELALTDMQKGLEPKSEAYKALEKGKKEFSRDFLRTSASESVTRNGGDSNKAFDEVLSQVEEKYNALIKDSGKGAAPLFPDEDAKTAFKGYLRKITGEKDRLLLDVKDGAILSKEGRVDGKELPSYTDDKIAAFMEKNPAMGDIRINHVRANGKIDEALLSKSLMKDGFVYLGNPSGDKNTAMAIKFSEPMADSVLSDPAAVGMSKEDRFLFAFVKDVLGLKGITAENYGALYKRWKNLDNHDPRLDLRDEAGKPVVQKHYFFDETLGDKGLIDEGLVHGVEDRIALKGVLDKNQGDGAGWMTEEGHAELIKQMNMVGNRGVAKYSLVHDNGVDTGLIKSNVFPMPKAFQTYMERKLGVKLGKFDVIHPTDNMKLGKENLLAPVEGATKGVSIFEAPASAAQVKMTNPHKQGGAKFSVSIYARLGADAGLNEAFLSHYKPEADKFLSLVNELKTADKTNVSIRKALDGFSDLGIQIDEADWAVMDKMLKQKASGRDIWSKIDKSIVKKFRSSILSGKMGFQGTHLALMPDMGSKGGLSLSSLKDTPEARAAYGSFVDVANLFRGGTGKAKSAEALQSWEATFGRGTIAPADVKLLSSKEATLWDALGVLEEAKRMGTLNEEGKRFLQQENKRIYIQPDEVMLSDHDFAAMGKPRTGITSRFPVTRLTANARARVLRGSDYGMKIPDGNIIASNHDVSIRKEGDYDDHYSFFPEGGPKGVPEGFGDAVEAERLLDGEVVLSGLSSHETGPLSVSSAVAMGQRGNQGKEGIGIASSIARVLAAMEDSGMTFAGKKLKMTFEKKRFLSQVQQEAADAVNKKDLSERLRKSGFDTVDELLVDKLFDLNGDTRKNKQIRYSLNEFQTVFNLANEGKPLKQAKNDAGLIDYGTPDTEKLAASVQLANDLRERILASGGRVPPTMDLLSLLKGIKGVPGVTIEGSQLSDVYAVKKLKTYTEDKYGKDTLAIASGTPEDRIIKKVEAMQGVTKERDRKFREAGLKGGTKEAKAFNDETKAIEKQRKQDALDTYSEILSNDGLDADQIRRITFGLLTKNKTNKNWSPVSKGPKLPYGGKDVQRFNEMFNDDELAMAYYTFRDEASGATKTSAPPSVMTPPVTSPTAPTAAQTISKFPSLAGTKQSPTAKLKTLGK